MKCIDGIEGVLRTILEEFSRRHAEGELDDTQYAQNVRSVIKGAAPFLEQNKEIGISSELLEKVLYDTCKNWWLAQAAARQAMDAEEDRQDAPVPDEGYGEYYFDYLYKHGTYPA